MDEKHRRLLRNARERRQEKRSTPEYEAPAHHHSNKRSGLDKLYHDHYRILMLITFGMLIVSLGIIGYTYVSTGDIIYKGVSISGGVTLSVSTSDLTPINIERLQEQLRTTYPDNDIQVREISEFGTQQGITLEATTATNDRESLDNLAQRIIADLSNQIPNIEDRASTEITGPSLGASFFEQTIKAVLIAFIFMALVVFLYFGESTWQKILTFILTLIEAVIIWNASNVIMGMLGLALGAALIYLYIRYSIPSTAVILAAFSTIMFTIAVVDLFHIRLSTAGIAAFLMLVGYSVDTDILLSTRVLKNTAGTVYERIKSTMKTGITMTGTTFVAAAVGFTFTQSDVVKEIMLIIMIGIIADIYNTWIQNAGILRWYLERKSKSDDP